MSETIKRFTKRDHMDDVVREIRRNGVAIIEQLFEPETMDSLAAVLHPELEQQQPGGGDFFGNAKRSVTGIFAKGAQFSEHLLLNDCLLEVVDGILLPDYPMASHAVKPDQPYPANPFHHADPLVGPNCHHYRVNASVAMQVCKGGSNQTLHRDEWRYLPYMHRDPDGPELTVANMVAVTDFTLDNGATRYLPGSNNWSADRQPTEAEVVQADMPKGSVAVWLGSVLHGLGTNKTDTPRTGIIFSYVVDHMTQEENQFMAVPVDIAAKLPKRAQQLIGYRSSYALNFIEGIDDNHVLKVES